MSSGPPDAGAVAAAMAALHAFNVEAFTLLGIALTITALRSYTRISTVGWRNLWADDYLVVIGAIFYVVETVLAYNVGNKAHGLANNSMTDEARASLQSTSPEYQTRVLGSKIQLCGWTSYSLLLWTLKGAMCTFYYRLTRDLEGYRRRIYFGFAFIALSWLVVMLNLLLSCRPFHHMWQIHPNPGIYCQPAISPALIWTYLSFNVATDMYLIAIPIPMLVKAAMPVLQRIWLVCLFSCGLFVTMAAIMRVVLLVSDPINGAQLAGSWAVRETFVAVVTTNLPMLFPHFKRWAGPLLACCGIRLESTKRSGDESDPTTLDTWRSKGRRTSHRMSVGPVAGQCTESEERIVDECDVNSLGKDSTVLSPSTADAAIQRQLEVTIWEEDARRESSRSSTRSGNYTSTWSSNVVDSKPAERSEYFGDHIHQSAY